MARKKKPMPIAMTTREALLDVEKQLNGVFVQRSNAVRVILLATLSSEHYMLIGDPGTGKTALATRFQSHIDGSRYFKTLLGTFTPPEKVFGALDIAEFKQGKYTSVTDGMLPGVEFAMLDEVLKCNEGALNEMLTVLNEREFNGDPIPLMTCGTATNWPELEKRTEMVRALYDRFLLRCIVEPVEGETDQVRVLEASEKVNAYQPRTTVTLDALKTAIDEVKQVTIAREVRLILVKLRASLAWTKDRKGNQKPGVFISDRRVGQVQSILRASAWLDGRSEVTLEDFSALQFGLWNERSEYAQVTAAIGTLDTAAVNNVTQLIDEGMRSLKSYRPGSGHAQLNSALSQAAAKATSAKKLFDKPVFTNDSRTRVRKKFVVFKSEYTRLAAEVRKLVESQA